MEAMSEESVQSVNVENAIDLTTEKDGGVLKEIKKEGVGEDGPISGDEVVVHYVGTLLSGEKFDSSRDRNDKFKFTLGKGSVIKAWDIGVATMKRGEVCNLTCKPEYAYGETGSPPKIPPNATLVFEVELFDWHGEDVSENKDGGILKSIIEEANEKSYSTPNAGASVEVHITGKYEDRVFDDRDVEFCLEEGESQNIIEGIEVALRKFKKGEKSLLRIKSPYAFGVSGKAEWNIPPNADVIYTVHLTNFEKAKESWQMDEKEKLEQSEFVKTKGTNCFKGENYTKAIYWYKKITTYLSNEDNFKDEMAESRRGLLLAAHLNIAMCHLKLNENAEAIKECNDALDLDEKNVKALFRRGQGHMNLWSYEEARKDFQNVLKFDAENKAAKKQLALCQQKVKKEKEKERHMYAGMFTKFAERDAKRQAYEESLRPNGFQDVSEWDNSLASGLMSLDDQKRAFDGDHVTPQTTPSSHPA